jgi:polysaccharide biosynthesis transport protein
VSNPIIKPSDAGYPMSGPMEEYASASSPTGLRRIVFFLRKFWWVPLLTLILALAAALAYIRYWAPPSFVSKASMWVAEQIHLPEGAAFSEDIQSSIGNQIELLRSAGMEKRVVARMQAANTNSVPSDEDGKPIKIEVTVKQAPKSTIFTIEAVTANPVYSQSYLDALLIEYREFKKYYRKTVSGDTLASISEQVLSLETDLKEQEAALAAFERTNNLVILQEQGTVAGTYLAKLQTELSDLKLESQLLDATPVRDLASSENTNGRPDLADSFQQFGSTSNAAPSSGQSIPFIQSAPPSIPLLADFGAQELRKPSSVSNTPPSAHRKVLAQELELLEGDRAKLSYLLPTNPRILQMDAQIERDEKAIEAFRQQDLEQSRQQDLEQSREQYQQRVKYNRIKMESIAASIKQWEGKVVEANSLITTAEHLKANLSRTQSLHDRLATILDNVNISRNIDQDTLTILEQASPSVRTYSQELRLLETSGVGGLGLGLCLVVLIGFRDDRFNSIAEVSEKFGDVIVGQVPDIPTIRGKTRTPLLEVEDERDMYAEAYRSLRSAIFFMPGEGERPKILLVTSALPNEGKSTIALNLARTLALGGSRVVLIDADVRQGHLHDLLGTNREPGLTDLLQHPEDLDNILQRNCSPNLWFISCGWTVSRPGDLFVGPAVELLFARLRQQFDFVVIDTSPVFASDDVATLAPRADGTLFVVRSRFSPAGAVKEALDVLGQRQVRVLGLVFNRADASTRSYNYANRAYYRPKKTA